MNLTMILLLIVNLKEDHVMSESEIHTDTPPPLLLEDSQNETGYSFEDDPLDCGMRSSSEADSD